jgi:phosphopantothenoylcysteine synthetase/decarboxylase
MRTELTGPAPPDVVIHAMAVLDYAPAAPQAAKTPSGREEWTIRLVRTPKVIRHIRDWHPEVLLVQFKLEVDLSEPALRRAALDSLRRNHADIVVANDLAHIGADAHPALILDADGTLLARPDTKPKIAAHLCDVLEERT